jgi:hypothetical protein
MHQFTHKLDKTISKGCWVCWAGKNKKDNYIAGRFIAKALQRNLLRFCYSVSKHIAEIILDDIACYP